MGHIELNPILATYMVSKMISAFVREERNNQGLTQKDLADMAQVSLRSITSIEAERSVKKDTIEKVLQTLGYKLVIRYDFIESKK